MLETQVISLSITGKSWRTGDLCVMAMGRGGGVLNIYCQIASGGVVTVKHFIHYIKLQV